MKRRSGLWAIALPLGLAGCTAIAVIGGSAVGPADQWGGVVSNVTQFTNPGALQLAGAHCAQYGRTARVTGLELADNRLFFACIAP
jgi:hypothetical protein